MSFESCIREAVFRNEITQEDADNIIGIFKDDLMRGMARPAARAKASRRLREAGEWKHAQAVLQMAASEKNDRHLSTHLDHRGRHDPIGGAYGLFEDFGYSGETNVRGYAEAALGVMRAKAADAMEKFRRKTLVGDMSLAGGRKNVAQMGDLQRALSGEPSSPEMQELAGGLLEAADYGRRLFNDLSGETIPKLEIWGGPQSYDRHAVEFIMGAKTAAEAKENLANLFDPRLDWSRMRDPIGGQLYGADVPSDHERRRIMNAAWENIVTGGVGDDRPNLTQGAKRAIANSRSDHRFFVYKNAQARMEVAKEVGYGDTISGFDHYFRSIANDIGMMKVFGPNPAAEVRRIKELVRHEGDMLKRGRPSLLADKYTRKNVMDAVHKFESMMDAYYEQFRGDGLEDNGIALSGAIIRNWSLGALMGSASLIHVAINPGLQVFGRYMGGVPLWTTLPQLAASFSKMSKAEIIRAGLDVEQASHDLHQLAKSLTGLRRWERMSRWLPDRVVHLSGLETVVRVNKSAFRRGMMSMLADLQDKTWGDLPERVQSKMKGYGITSVDWELIRMADLYEPAPGSAKWLRWKEIGNVGTARPRDVLSLYGHDDLFDKKGDDLAGSDEGRDKAAKIAMDVALKMLAYIQGETEVAVPSHSIGMRAAMSQLEPKGKGYGAQALRQIVLSGMQFKGYLSSFLLTQALGIQHELTRGKFKGATYAASLAIVLTILGVAVVILKNLANGKDVPSLDLRTKEGLETLAQGFVTGGATGWVGDFLANSSDGWGHGPLEAIAGPAAGTTIRAAHLLGLLAEMGWEHSPWGKPKRGARTTAQQKLAESALGMLQYQTPLLSSLWYGRAAFDRMVVDQLRHLADPDHNNYFKGQTNRLLKGRGQKFWWRPGQTLPDRWPALSGRGFPGS